MDETLQHIRKLAEFADVVMVRTIEAMAEFSAIASSQLSVPRNRIVVPMTLARASIDYGRGLVALIGTDHQDLGGPALSLLRAQLELTLRSAFFSEHASDQELSFFLKNDEMPKRSDKKGGGKRISLNRLAVIVEPTFASASDSRMSGAVNSALPLLNGHVHGGTPLLRSYYHQSDVIGFVPRAGLTIQTLRYSYAFANLAMIVLARASKMDGNQHCPVFEAPYEAAKIFLEELDRL